MLEGFADIFLPAADRADHEARVDIVEVVVGPVPGAGFDVVDLEVHVPWNHDWLDRAEVSADDGGVGVFVGHFQGPDPGAGADVEDGEIGFGGKVGGERREVELVVAEEGHDVVFEVDAVKFLIIIGERVGASHVAMVPTPVLIFIVENTGWERGALMGGTLVNRWRVMLVKG